MYAHRGQAVVCFQGYNKFGLMISKLIETKQTCVFVLLAFGASVLMSP